MIHCAVFNDWSYGCHAVEITIFLQLYEVHKTHAQPLVLWPVQQATSSTWLYPERQS